MWAWRNPAGQGCEGGTGIFIIDYCPLRRAVSSVGQSASFTPRRSEVQVLHRPPCREGLARTGPRPGMTEPRWRNGRRAAFRAQCPYGCVGSNPSLGTKPLGRPNGIDRALVAQRIERCPAEAEVVSSNLAKRAISFPHFLASVPATPAPFTSVGPRHLGRAGEQPANPPSP